MSGPGKYDDWCSRIIEQHHPQGVLVMVVGGDRGEGFSVQAIKPAMDALPRALRIMADAIEQQLKSGQETN